MNSMKILLCAFGMALVVATGSAVRGDDGVVPFDSGIAINDPDQFNWDVFAAINQPAGVMAHPADVRWETWASDPDTFPPKGKSPQWPDPENACKQLTRNVQRAAIQTDRIRIFVNPFPNLDDKGNPLPDQQETRRNRATFDFIVGNNLWNIAGLKAAFASAAAIQAPVPSIEVKADWFPAVAGDEATFHVNTDCTGLKWKLVSLHVITKALPNWTWATFEHVSNPGRCDYIGCADHFGATQPVTKPTDDANPAGAMLTVGSVYPAADSCTKTKAVLDPFAANGLDPRVWSNYCLKGSQVDFTDSTGQPIRLGNSVTEAGFVRTSSCMSCHARASVDAKGIPNLFPGFIATSQAPGEPAVGPVGTPLPTWFVSQDVNGLPPYFKQTDFIWGVGAVQQ
ncbi:MAG: hypothetical protein P4M09_00190 [Devosia sp.]|nr:hypothetical protein [Devosia sp.]